MRNPVPKSPGSLVASLHARLMPLFVHLLLCVGNKQLTDAYGLQKISKVDFHIIIFQDFLGKWWELWNSTPNCTTIQSPWQKGNPSRNTGIQWNTYQSYHKHVLHMISHACINWCFQKRGQDSTGYKIVQILELRNHHKPSRIINHHKPPSVTQPLHSLRFAYIHLRPHGWTQFSETRSTSQPFCGHWSPWTQGALSETWLCQTWQVGMAFKNKTIQKRRGNHNYTPNM